MLCAPKRTSIKFSACSMCVFTMTQYDVYQYRPLRGDGRQSVRFMSLLPAESNTEQLCIFLEELSLEELRDVEALSYVWGDAKDLRPILVTQQGSAEFATTYITANLDEALRALRPKSVTRLLWVDAVCINQPDTKEKEGQIELMSRIYSEVQRCLIWLGPEDVQTRHVFQVRRGFPRIRERLPKWIVRHKLEGRYSLMRFEAADRKLHDRPWFHRLWTLQEVLLAKSALVVCGSITLEWDLFAAPVIAADGRNRWGTQKDFQTLQKPQLENTRIVGCALGAVVYDATKVTIPQGPAMTWSMTYRRAVSGLVYGEHCRQIRASSAFNPIDKVIGTLGFLSSHGMRFPPMPYSLGAEKIYALATKTWLAHMKSLDILAFAAVDDVKARGASWIVNWQQASAVDGLINTLYCAVGEHSRAQAKTTTFLGPMICASQASEHIDIGLETDDPMILRVKGHIVDALTACTAQDRKECELPELPIHERWDSSQPKQTVDYNIDSLNEVMRRANATSGIRGLVIEWLIFLCDTSPNDEDLSRKCSRLVQLLLLNDYWHVRDLPVDLTAYAFAAAAKWLSSVLQDRGSMEAVMEFVQDNEALSMVLDSSKAGVYNILALRTTFETLFVTHRGEVGLCPAQNFGAGGTIAVALLAGSRFPVILRPTSITDNSRTYTYLGPAWVSGYMHGALWDEERVTELLLI
ncbi:Heterokaryon incompatibility protein 6, OR allele [Pseudocercospora fuligena]|uniref:Heterokaryon incompatibility protein 6, OR allele n=1 Tax=Pseudocercospora fuligena TaxID=685502 RepID=A0A8H6RV32_9PEZI|nr:Heterokaryon incompatibility protein 6, OR allele [Pseudocercospora fuligena]